jgi:large subunit ribosomal protein L6
VKIEKIENRSSSSRTTTRAFQANAMSGTCGRSWPTWCTGVSKGFEAKLNLVGVGYRAQAQGDKLNLTLGFSHPVVHQMPKGVKVETPTQTEIVIKGIDKQLVGQVAAEVRAYRRRSPTRARACVTRTRSSCSRKPRRSRGRDMMRKDRQARLRRARQTRARSREN